MSFSWKEEPVFCFSSDVDWASEVLLEYSHKIIYGKDIKLTYFNTHPSNFISKLSSLDKSKQLIHPNFLPNSSHGNSYSEVIEYFQNFLPNANGFRTHRYFEVNDIMDEFAKRDFKFFSNHCTRCEQNITPLYHRSGMVSIPIFIEDGGFLIMDPSLNKENLKKQLETPGLKIINFHPAHMAFNTPDFAYTRKIKDSMNRNDWNNIDNATLVNLEYKGFGIRNIIQYIIEFAFKGNFKIKYMNEIYEEFIFERNINN